MLAHICILERDASISSKRVYFFKIENTIYEVYCMAMDMMGVPEEGKERYTRLLMGEVQ